jgi:hypothetical protein
MTQAGAPAKNAARARTAEITRATTAVMRAGRLPCRAGTSASSVTSPSSATTMLTASGGATDEPMTPSSAMSTSPRTAKMAAGAADREGGRSTVWELVSTQFLLYSMGLDGGD